MFRVFPSFSGSTAQSRCVVVGLCPQWVALELSPNLVKELPARGFQPPGRMPASLRDDLNKSPGSPGLELLCVRDPG